jgi:membrane fusion protein, multidrug efflux system
MKLTSSLTSWFDATMGPLPGGRGSDRNRAWRLHIWRGNAPHSALTAYAPGFVSGHGFSRAANREQSEGFSPCLSGRGIRTCAPGLRSQGLKPSNFARSARLKPCPDTKPGRRLCAPKCSNAGRGSDTSRTRRQTVFTQRAVSHRQRGRGVLFPLFALVLLALTGRAETSELVPVVSKPVSQTVELPGELLPFLIVSVHAKVPGYVERILVDRGSMVKQGELIAELSAPEMAARIAEAESKARAAEADRSQAEVQLAAAQSTYERMKKAAETPGSIAGNELVLAEKQVDAARAALNSRQQASLAAESAVRTLQDLRAYLKIAAPFEGVVTERMAHPGALAGPGNDVPLMIIQQISRLRLVAQVPEEDVGGIVPGASVPFQAPAWPERTYSGVIARVSHVLDQQTRTMAVELDVMNRDGSLAPGMYAKVKWPVRRSRPALFVPKTSVVTTTERTFVIRDQGGKAGWVDVRKGVTGGDLVEVIGNLKQGDRVIRRATDEIRDGAPLQLTTRREP